MVVPSIKSNVQTTADPKQLPLDPGGRPVMEDVQGLWDFNADVSTVAVQMWEDALAK